MTSKIARFFKESAFKLLRIAGILLIIYISMVFYLALTERRNAFPRAIYHKEANEAIQGKAKALACTLDDGTVLNGFSLGNENDPVMLYYPEADEDAAQFLAQLDSAPGINIVTFNYRGSAQNKGTRYCRRDTRKIRIPVSQIPCPHKPQSHLGQLKK